MSWNYRVVVRPDGMGGAYYAIHEAYYDKAGRVWAITENPAVVDGDTPEEVEETRIQMGEARRRPILNYDAIPEAGAVSPYESTKADGAA